VHRTALLAFEMLAQSVIRAAILAINFLAVGFPGLSWS